MARSTEFYKGRRKKRNYAIVPFAVVLGLAVLVVVLFYSMQQYAVITKEGISLELPILSTEKMQTDSAGNTVKFFEPVDVELQFEQPDYSNIRAVAGARAKGLRAIYVPDENMNRDKIMEYANRLSTGNALVLEMKPRSGIAKWCSHAAMAINYGLSQETEAAMQMPSIITELKAKNIYLVARISCCIDELLSSRSTTMTLRTETGFNYSDANGIWLDAYNTDVRNYVVQMTQELYDMGFDEVLLADVAHPVTEADVKLLYTREMSTPPDPVTAVCGFALYVTDALQDRGISQLSIELDSAEALVGPTASGQDARLFMKVFDRVYMNTDKYSYSYNLNDIRSNITIGTAQDRLIPIMKTYLFDNASEMSWVLVD